MAPDEPLGTLVVRRRDDRSWDLLRRGEPDEVLSNHPLQAMAESERHRLAQEDARDPTAPGDDPGPGTIGAYPDNTGG